MDHEYAITSDVHRVQLPVFYPDASHYIYHQPNSFIENYGKGVAQIREMQHSGTTPPEILRGLEQVPETHTRPRFDFVNPKVEKLKKKRRARATSTAGAVKTLPGAIVSTPHVRDDAVDGGNEGTSEVRAQEVQDNSNGNWNRHIIILTMIIMVGIILGIHLLV